MWLRQGCAWHWGNVWVGMWYGLGVGQTGVCNMRCRPDLSMQYGMWLYAIWEVVVCNMGCGCMQYGVVGLGYGLKCGRNGVCNMDWDWMGCEIADRVEVSGQRGHFIVSLGLLNLLKFYKGG